jgi:membrane fusion protein (multidrug efflux system)
MKMSALLLTAVAATWLSAPANPQDVSRKQQDKEPTKKVKELQKERVAVLKELTEQLLRLYQSARVDVDEVVEARVRLFQAEAEAADKQSDRLALYRKLVDELTQYETIAQGRVNAARGSTTSVLKIKARRLEAEIHLEQAKGQKSPGDKKSDVGHDKIVVSNPKIKKVLITQQYVCQIRAHRHITVRALQTGSIETIPVKEGQVVKKGDVIYQIAPNLYKAKLDAELAEVKLAELECANVEKLFQQNVVAQNEVALYQAKLARARAKADLAKAELNFTQTRAPFDGIIGQLHEQQGSMIKEGESLTTLSDNSMVWAYFNVPEARYLEYMAGREKEKDEKIELVLANGKKFSPSGKIGAIEARLKDQNGMIRFRADFANPEGLLRHGMSGNVLSHRTLDNAIVIPQGATFEILDKRYVYIVDKDDVARRREILVRDELENFFVIQKGRIGADDRIIVEGIRQVRDGAKVKYEYRPPAQ